MSYDVDANENPMPTHEEYRVEISQRDELIAKLEAAQEALKGAAPAELQESDADKLYRDIWDCIEKHGTGKDISCFELIGVLDRAKHQVQIYSDIY